MDYIEQCIKETIASICASMDLHHLKKEKYPFLSRTIRREVEGQVAHDEVGCGGFVAKPIYSSSGARLPYPDPISDERTTSFK